MTIAGVGEAMQADAVLALADTLEAEGRAERAIEILQRANRNFGDARLEQRLVSLRCAAFAERRRMRPAMTSWPAHRAPIARDGGLPVTTLADLTPQLISGAILSAGCLLVRGLFDAERVGRLRTLIDTAHDAYRAHEAGAPRNQTSAWYDPVENLASARLCAHSISRNAGGSAALLVADSPRGLCWYLELLHELGLDRMIEVYLGAPPVLGGDKTTFRIARPYPETEGWHQDGRFLGHDVRSLNLWVAVTDCGVRAPGLDLVTKRFEHIVPTGTDGVPFDWLVSDALVVREYSDSIARPAFRAGDALFFDHLLLHRTAANGAQMTEPRYAIESWFFAPFAYPQGQTPVCV